MRAEVDDHTFEVQTDIKNALGLTIRLALEDIHRRSNPVTPLRDNGLRTSVLKTMPSLDRGVIEWKVPYAAVQEQGYRTDPRTGKTVMFTNYTTPGTGSGFAENSVKQTMQHFDEIAKQGGLI